MPDLWPQTTRSDEQTLQVHESKVFTDRTVGAILTIWNVIMYYRWFLGTHHSAPIRLFVVVFGTVVPLCISVGNNRIWGYFLRHVLGMEDLYQDDSVGCFRLSALSRGNAINPESSSKA